MNKIAAIKDIISLLHNQYNDLFTLLFKEQFTIPKEIIPLEIVQTLIRHKLIIIDEKTSNIKSLVKINYTNGIFLLTDFITQKEKRVFPFVDEGNIQQDYFSHVKKIFTGRPELTIWDMCTGAGHPLLVMEKNCNQICDEIEVIGTDINVRAVAFANQNIKLNNSNAKVMLSDFDKEIPHNVMFDYIWANPPFALSPKNDSLHTYGGRYGLDKTIKCLEKVKSRLKPNSAAQVLSYSVGSPKKLLVEQYLEKIISPWKYNITILSEKSIWRFHGLKRCINPMPIEYMALRATDSFYNLSNIPKESWLELADEIKQNGHSHLYLILIDIYS